MFEDLRKSIPALVQLTTEAGREILDVYERDFSVEYKDDKSPLTEADNRSNALIVKGLKDLFQEIPILSEEEADIEYHRRKGWGLFWLVDPLDGTKEFMKRNGEFTINIALVSQRQPVFGMIYIPVQELLYLGGPLLNGVFRLKTRDMKDYSVDAILDDSNRVSKKEDDHRNGIVVVGSRSHGSDRLRDFVEVLGKKYPNVEFVSAGSALKFCLIAEGKADLYPRFGPTMEWDTAAGHAIVLVMGARVLRTDTLEELNYNKVSLKNPDFIVTKEELIEEITSFFRE
ncbi:MAG: 3'(2'),5'-bisphosphate nucleotidase CysQ [Nitrospirae bacterium]|nr:3'(2'),5'-bisphosphate nucleotidase CysQ [Nitrospirota bacterium]